MSGNHYQRAVILVERRRHADASLELGRHIAHQPNDPWAYSLLAVCHSVLKKDEEAIATAKHSIGLDPDESWFHYILADLYYRQNLLYESRHALSEAIRLAPHVARYWGLKANIDSALCDWDSALKAAETGLEHDPGSVHCQNLRALALAKLGKKGEARNTLEKALSSDPENSLTFAYQGWTHIHNGEAQAAINAFTEALRLQPDLEWARLGMMNALRERHPLFATARRLSRPLPLLLVTLVFIGCVVTFFYCMQLRNSVPWLWPIAAAPTIASFLLLLLAWLPVDSVDDTLLRVMMQFDPRGKLLLTEEERKRANLTAICMAIGIPVGIVIGVIRHSHKQSHAQAAIQATRAAERAPGFPVILISFAFCVALIYAVAIANRKKAVEKRILLAQALVAEATFVILIMIACAITLTPKPVAQIVTYVFVAACVGLAFTRAPLKLVGRIQSAAYDLVWKIWPHES